MPGRFAPVWTSTSWRRRAHVEPRSRGSQIGRPTPSFSVGTPIAGRPAPDCPPVGDCEGGPRLREINGRWIASADTPDGPSLGLGEQAIEAIQHALQPFNGIIDELLASVPRGRLG